ncbi:MAG: DNA mismatch repair endonuclease MutL [Lachnospiraceae bacterium]|nr:DNA mismatch repair endonuclease MutL [Lachnospiraceae bacterium]
MPQIELLSQETINQIAAGEVIERPSSVVKELVENAIDAKATAVTVEIKEGGISFIRITDNGCGIEKEQIPLAFLRHSTSKIHSVEDLLTVKSLGFRGEALSSIAAVAQVELITKTPEEFSGVRYVIEGSKEQSVEDVGAPDGTTFLVRNLFYNTPARRKFLKSPQTEGGYISDLMQRMVLSHPDIAFKFIMNGQVKLQSSGNGNQKEIIYHIYGRDITGGLLPLSAENELFAVEGFIGKPQISRGNRTYETYFINGRYIKSSLLSRAIEEAYKPFLMQHQYPFTVLYFKIDSDLLDINVHPTKMELRFSNQQQIYQKLVTIIQERLRQRELIPQVPVVEEKKKPQVPKIHQVMPEPFERRRIEAEKKPLRSEAVREDITYHAHTEMPKSVTQPVTSDMQSSTSTAPLSAPVAQSEISVTRSSATETQSDASVMRTSASVTQPGAFVTQADVTAAKIASAQNTTDSKQSDHQQTDVKLEEREERKGNVTADIKYEQQSFLTPEAMKEHRIIGQVFDTYWLVQFGDKLYIIDQHAAHEKVLYERTMKNLKNKEYTSQRISPPIILTLSMLEEQTLKKYRTQFEMIGYEIEHFGGNEYAVSAVPGNMFQINAKDLILQMIDEVSEVSEQGTPDLILEKVASMSCKAAVKGNHKLSLPEIEELIEELLTLENPYNCPHGRPTIISMSKYELERKFKRIV